MLVFGSLKETSDSQHLKAYRQMYFKKIKKKYRRLGWCSFRKESWANILIFLQTVLFSDTGKRNFSHICCLVSAVNYFQLIINLGSWFIPINTISPDYPMFSALTGCCFQGSKKVFPDKCYLWIFKNGIGFCLFRIFAIYTYQALVRVSEGSVHPYKIKKILTISGNTWKLKGKKIMPGIVPMAFCLLMCSTTECLPFSKAGFTSFPMQGLFDHKVFYVKCFENYGG